MERVFDVNGMSGGPIYGVKTMNGEARYFIAGIQSGWFPSQRIVTLCAATPFFERVKAFALRG